MRISFISPEFVTEPSFSGGLANYLARVSRALQNDGHDVHVLTRSASRDNSTVDYHGVTVHRVVPLWDERMVLDHVDPLVPRQHYNFYQDIKAAWCLRRKWNQLNREKAFDLVQTANVSACGFFFRNEKRTPIITRLSSYRPLWDTLSGADINSGLKMRWKFEQKAIEGTRYHYAPSDFVARETQDNYHVGDVDVIETPFFREVPQPDDCFYNEHLAGKDYLLYFGQHNRMKGTHLIGEALPQVLDRHPSLHCVFAGRDSNLAPDGGSMRAYVRRLNESNCDRLHFVDPLRHDQLYPVIENSIAVLIPSLADNLPNTCLESMGLGKTVIAATDSCFEQLITHRENGFLAEQGSAESLAQVINDVLALSPETRAIIGAHARESIGRLHPDKAIPKLIDYYASVIEQFQQQQN
ncbi:MAG: glycosyltransferase involved in cell wall biosynthesis [Verrucomicrobiales bacterium]|jgi:glycosyltransferase involved in cell wall biosynthesis